MTCFIIHRRPKSFNGWKISDSKSQKYLRVIIESFAGFHPKHEKLTGELYGTVYYFYRNVHPDSRQDADNISKPLWDCLRDVMYLDDKQVRLRIAGIVDLSKDDISQWSLPPAMIKHFNYAIDNHDHFIYVECGTVHNTMFRFNLEIDEN